MCTTSFKSITFSFGFFSFFSGFAESPAVVKAGCGSSTEVKGGCVLLTEVKGGCGSLAEVKGGRTFRMWCSIGIEKARVLPEP